MILLEAIAIISTLICVYLTSKEKIWAWPIGIVGVIACFIIFLDEKFYFQVGLQVIFFFQSLYGWYKWKKGTDDGDLPIRKKQNVKLATEVGLIFLLSTYMGYFIGVYTDSTLPYMDGISTGMAILATYYLAHKYIGAWLIWMGVNTLLCVMFIIGGLYLMAGLEVVLFIISLNAYKRWKRNTRMDFA